MTVLITGDTGFIGSNMKEFLQNKGESVAGYSRRNGYNIFNITQLSEAVKGVNTIYHFAAEAKPGESVQQSKKNIEIYILGTLNVLEICRKYDLQCVYPSSCEIYGARAGLSLIWLKMVLNLFLHF